MAKSKDIQGLLYIFLGDKLCANFQKPKKGSKEIWGQRNSLYIYCINREINKWSINEGVMNYRRWRKATLIGNAKDFIGRKKGSEMTLNRKRAIKARTRIWNEPFLILLRKDFWKGKSELTNKKTLRRLSSIACHRANGQRCSDASKKIWRRGILFLGHLSSCEYTI